jgi:hypothetical protein
MRLLSEHPEVRVSLDTPPTSIAADSVVQWHELGTAPYTYHPRRKRGTLLVWKMRNKYDYGSFTLHRPEYEQISHHESTAHWTCDITDVQGFAASKSELRIFASTDKMVETNSRDMIDTITHEKLAKNLAHSEIRIIHAPGSDHFARYLWDDRLFLINSGGSHHFAAAKYIAARLSEPVVLSGKLSTYSLNALAIASLRRDFEMFALSDETTISRDFHNAMTALKATWLWHHLPRPFDNARAILLPKSEARSMRAATLLRRAGVTDLGKHLANLASQ